MQMRQQCRQLIARFKCGNAIELRLERRKALAIDGGRVHAGGVFIADLLLVGSARIALALGVAASSRISFECSRLSSCSSVKRP